MNVLKRMREFVNEKLPQRLGFGFSFGFRSLVVFHKDSAKLRNLRDDWIDDKGPHDRTLWQSWQASENAIEKALSFVDNKMGWSRRALLPSMNAVIVLAVAFDKAGFKQDSEEESLYRRWLCLTALRGVFQGSVETTMNRFLRAIRNSRRHPAEAVGEALTRSERAPIHEDELMGYAQTWGPATQVMHAWLVSQRAKDWRSEDLIDKLARGGDTSLPGGDLTVHHIFPRNLFKDSADEPNRAANYALLSRSTNSEFHETPPDEVLNMLSSSQRKLATIQIFGRDAGDLLEPKRYDEFCEWRAKRLAESMNEWLGLE